MSREAMQKAHDELAALIPAPLRPQVDDWPCGNPADRECLQRAYTVLRSALSEPVQIDADEFPNTGRGMTGRGVRMAYATDHELLEAGVPPVERRVAAPQGYVLVPVEPSQEYWDKVWERIKCDGHITGSASVVQIKRMFDACHAAMLEAAEAHQRIRAAIARHS